ncbi:lipopolysaccharide biosynthesis [Alteromonadaceae bacterium BrNp21-10]|nr:lipopolysaccharide biosynthesis [Alteromonadaceae bacterium BrNp21-10]
MIGIRKALDEVLTYVKGIWIKKRYIIISCWLICPVGWSLVATMPDVYRSSARVFVDTNSLLRPMLQGLAMYSDPQQQVSLVARTLLTRPTLEKIAREADLDITAKNQSELDRIIDGLKSNIRLSGTSDKNNYTISYSSQNPVLAQKIVQITLNEFVETSLGSSRKDGDSAEDFLDKQIKEYEQRLLEAEQRVADFKRSRMERTPFGVNNYYSQMENEKSQLAQAELSLSELNSQLDTINEQLSSGQPIINSGELVDNPNISSSYDNRIRSLQARVDEMLIQYTELYPEVVKTNLLIERLQEERKKELIALSEAATNNASLNRYGNPTDNPITQGIKIKAANIESEISSLKVRIEAYKVNVKKLEEKVNLVPQIEAESQALNRDYSIIKSKYMTMLQRKDAAEMSRKIDASVDDVQFRILEPPRLPKKPSGSTRLVFYTVTLIFGFGVGAAIAFLISLINPVVFSPYQLTQHFSVPILGAVSHFDAKRLIQIDKRRMIIFSISSAAIIGIYLIIMSVEIKYGKLPLDMLRNFV